MLQQRTCARCGRQLFVSGLREGQRVVCQNCGAQHVAHFHRQERGLAGLSPAVQSVLLHAVFDAAKKMLFAECPVCGLTYEVGEQVKKVDKEAGLKIEHVAIGAAAIAFVVWLFKGRR